MKTREISSPGNTTVKEAIRFRRKRNRYEDRLFLAEGEDLLAAALESGYLPRQVFVLEGSVAGVMEALGQTADDLAIPEPDIDIFICTAPVMDKLSELSSSSRVVAVFDFIDRPLEETGGLEAGADTDADAGWENAEAGREDPGAGGAGPLVYIADVRDPGNAGSIIRSAAVLGARGAAFSPDAADPFSFKAQRAAMGATFRLPVHIDVTPAEIIAWAGSREWAVIASDPHEGKALWDKDVEDGQLMAGDFVLLLGSERQGVPGELLEASQLRLRIPQSPGAESLNVAMAGTVILYEALRQRVAKQ